MHRLSEAQLAEWLAIGEAASRTLPWTFSRNPQTGHIQVYGADGDGLIDVGGNLAVDGSGMPDPS